MATGLNVMCVDVKELLRLAQTSEAPAAPVAFQQEPQQRPPLAASSSSLRPGAGYLIRGEPPRTVSYAPPLSPADPAVLAEVLRRPYEMASQRTQADTPKADHGEDIDGEGEGDSCVDTTLTPLPRFSTNLRPPPPHLASRRKPVTHASRRRGSDSPLLSFAAFAASRGAGVSGSGALPATGVTGVSAAVAAAAPAATMDSRQHSQIPLYPSGAMAPQSEASHELAGVDASPTLPVLTAATAATGVTREREELHEESARGGLDDASNAVGEQTPGSWSLQALRATFRGRQLAAARPLVAQPTSPYALATATNAAAGTATRAAAPVSVVPFSAAQGNTESGAAPRGFPSTAPWAAPRLATSQQMSAERQRLLLQDIVLDGVRADAVAYAAARRSQRARALGSCPAAVRQARESDTKGLANNRHQRTITAENAEEVLFVPGPFRRHVANPPTRRPKRR